MLEGYLESEIVLMTSPRPAAGVDGDVDHCSACDLSDGRVRSGKIADTVRNQLDPGFVDGE